MDDQSERATQRIGPVVGIFHLDGRRDRLRALIDEMLVTTLALRTRGIEPSQKEDREARVIVKRIIEQTFRG